MNEPEATNLPLSAVPTTWTDVDPAEDPNHFYLGRVDYVIDGDSVWVFIDINFEGLYARRNCRLIGIDAPDTQPEKEASKLWLAERLPSGSHVWLYYPRKDKYGRPLVGIYNGLTNPSLNRASLEAGMSLPYTGGAR